MSIDMTRVVPAEEMKGDSAKDTDLLKGMRGEAERYLTSFHWCERVSESYFGLGVGGIVAVFLFRIRPAQTGVDEWLWVIVGDLPSAYLVTDDAPNPACALRVYVNLMKEWVEAAAAGRPVDNLIPTNVPPTPEWARELKTRLGFLEQKILSRYKNDLRACEDVSPG